MEDAEGEVLQACVEIDRHVPAAHQVEPREGRVADHAVVREPHHVAEPLGHLVAGRMRHEEFRQQVGRDLVGDRRGVDAAARDGQCIVVDVGRDDRDPGAHGSAVDLARQQHREGVGLLPCRTAGEPGTDLVPAAAPLHETGKHVAGERLPGFGVAEEARDVDEEVAEQQTDLVRIRREPTQIGVAGGDPQRRHAGGGTAQHRRALVVEEVVAGPVADMLGDALQEHLV